MPAALRARSSSRNVVDKVSGCGIKDIGAPVYTRSVPSTRDIHNSGCDDATIPHAMSTGALSDDRQASTQLTAISAIVGSVSNNLVVVSVIVFCAYFGRLPHARWHHVCIIFGCSLLGSIHIGVQLVIVLTGVALFFGANPLPSVNVEKDPEIGTIHCSPVPDCTAFF